MLIIPQLGAAAVGEEQLKKLEGLIRDDKIDEAISRLDDLIKLNPEDPKLREMRDNLVESRKITSNLSKAMPPAARLDLEALLLLAQNADSAPDQKERKKLMLQFLGKSAAFANEYPDQKLWLLRAAAALELGRSKVAWEAGQRMIGLRAMESEDPKVREVMAALRLKGWLNNAPPQGPAIGERWENSLGMQFVPVGEVLFCIWETRVQDFSQFVEATKTKVGGDWKKPGFSQGSTHPVVHVSWNHAKAFCSWLTEKEQKQTILVEAQHYRLPTDAEWSDAVGLEINPDISVNNRSDKIRNVYPWGSTWPPPRDAGNYKWSLRVDQYDRTSPVGSFPANDHGIYDLGGNVWEWCEDSYYANLANPFAAFGQPPGPVMRGASWAYSSSDALLSSSIRHDQPSAHHNDVGFRVVVAFDSHGSIATTGTSGHQDSKFKLGTCCAKAKAAGMTCKHKCCVAATSAGRVCAKCNP